MKLIVLVSVAVSALSMAGCGTSGQVSASKAELNRTARAIIGTSLIGARGATPADQDKIDDTAAGLCGAKAWTQSECARHDAESRQ